VPRCSTIATWRGSWTIIRDPAKVFNTSRAVKWRRASASFQTRLH